MVSALSSVQDTNVSASRYWSALYAGWASAPASWPGRNIIPQGPSGETTPNPSPPSIQFTSPTADSTVKGTVQLTANAANARGVEFDAYYASEPSNVSTVGWHKLGDATSSGGGTWTLTYDTHAIPDQGNTGWGTVNLAAVALDSTGRPSAAREYHRVTVANGQEAGSPPDRTAITSYNRVRLGRLIGASSSTPSRRFRQRRTRSRTSG